MPTIIHRMNAQKVNVLLVDDQPQRLLSYEAILAPLEENLIRAGSAREALDFLLRINVAAVLIDVVMPEMDGFELASIVRGHPRFKSTPIIFVTAVSNTEMERLKGYEAGAVDYVSVPIVPEILRAKVAVFVELHRKTLELEALNLHLEQRVLQRTLALEEAASASRRLAAIVESSDDAIVSKDLNGIVATWNRGAERLFGYAADEIIGRPITTLIPPELQDEEPRILEQIRGGEMLDHYETMRMTKDGRRIPVSITISPIRDGAGRVVGASKIARDISSARRAEQQLLEAARHKEDFIAVLGHELRNPLSAILGSVQVLETVEQTAEEAAEMRAIIARQAALMKRLVDDLLDVTRINRGKIELRKAPVDLRELVLRTAEDQRRTIEERELLLSLELPADSTWCHGDAERLTQVLVNLLHNAVKFTPAGGRIKVSLQQEPSERKHGEQQQLEANAAELRQTQPDGPPAQEPESGQIVLRVSDTGLGMAPEIVERLFEPFVQADQTLERSQGGLGLGLALVKGLIELHGGSVTASSAGVGQGSEFVIRLPACQPGSTISNSHPIRSDRACRILLVDDRRDAIVPMSVLLRRDGHEVEAACDGSQALEIARRFLPQIVFCDIGLPGMSGYDVARELRQVPLLDKVFLAAVTGYGRAEDRDQALSAGFDEHVAKPISLDRIREIVAVAIEKGPSSAAQ